MNTYRTSEGLRVTQSLVERKVRSAKAEKLEQFFEEHGYWYCEDCNRNDCKPIDCSHDISVKEAKETGRTELAWDVNNITLRGRKCHQKYDKLNIQNG